VTACANLITAENTPVNQNYPLKLNFQNTPGVADGKRRLTQITGNADKKSVSLWFLFSPLVDF
jgi:hypothetical protein